MGNIKVLIVGYARHGKDTFAEMLGLPFNSSSEAAMELAIYPILQAKYNYQSMAECFEDRVNHRKEWHDLIKAYNTPDKTRLAREILKENDVYVGMRCSEEVQACIEQKIFDTIIWVDASGRLPPESKDSISIKPDCANFFVTNNETLDDLNDKALLFKDYIRGKSLLKKHLHISKRD